MIYLGIDGCRGGWFVVEISGLNDWRFGVYQNIKALVDAHPFFSLALIDMPIGLPFQNKRLCDSEARKLLGGKKASSIFSAPCRLAMQADDYGSASRINFENLGVKLSKQSWNITPKIRELDDWLSEKNGAPFRECHPELALWALNGKKAMLHGKKTAQGQCERLELLRHYFSDASAVMAKASASFPGKILQVDDIIDALSLAVTARLSQGDLDSVGQEKDEKGLTMEIVFAKTHLSCLPRLRHYSMLDNHA